MQNIISGVFGKNLLKNNENFSRCDGVLTVQKAGDKFNDLWDGVWTNLIDGNAIKFGDKETKIENDMLIIDKMFKYITTLYDEWMRIRDSVIKLSEFEKCAITTREQIQ